MLTKVITLLSRISYKLSIILVLSLLGAVLPLLFAEAADIRVIKSINYGYDKKLSLSLEEVHQQGIVDIGIERLQFRNQHGDIVAYTPTRVTGIPFCISQDWCWVFMWKTVYPLPAVFKFNPDPLSWTADPDPPVVYSRRGPAEEGFIEEFNPFLGFFGLLLFLITRFWFFCVIFFLSSILFIQINRYRELPEIHKVWVRRMLGILFSLAHLPIPFVNPFLLTAAILFIMAIASMDRFGVPLGITMLFTIFSFYLCAMIVARFRYFRRKTL